MRTFFQIRPSDRVIVPNEMQFSFNNILKRLLVSLLNKLPESQHRFSNQSYSQEGEDLVIKRYFEGEKTQLYYVDVGAHHPFRFSNTAIFYQNASNGINIEANKDLMSAFEKYRPRDSNLNFGVGKQAESLDFYGFQETALSTFSQAVYEERLRKGIPLKAVWQVPVKPLREILADHAKSKKIDFLTIDVEGVEFEVLQSNDWDTFRPQLVLVEMKDFTGIDKDPVSVYLKEKGYIFFAKTLKTVFFERSI